MSPKSRALWVLSLLVALLWPQARPAADMGPLADRALEWVRSESFDPARVADFSSRRGKGHNTEAGAAERDPIKVATLPSTRLAITRTDCVCGELLIDAVTLRPAFFAAWGIIRGPPGAA